MLTDAKPAGLVQAEHNADTPESTDPLHAPLSCLGWVFNPHRLPGYA